MSLVSVLRASTGTVQGLAQEYGLHPGIVADMLYGDGQYAMDCPVPPWPRPEGLSEGDVAFMRTNHFLGFRLRDWCLVFPSASERTIRRALNKETFTNVDEHPYFLIPPSERYDVLSD